MFPLNWCQGLRCLVPQSSEETTIIAIPSRTDLLTNMAKDDGRCWFGAI